ncbi:hypothetical protein GCM10010533_48860 [Mycolicibacterium pallens]
MYGHDLEFWETIPNAPARVGMATHAWVIGSNFVILVAFSYAAHFPTLGGWGLTNVVGGRGQLWRSPAWRH